MNESCKKGLHSLSNHKHAYPRANPKLQRFLVYLFIEVKVRNHGASKTKRSILTKNRKLKRNRKYLVAVMQPLPIVLRKKQKQKPFKTMNFQNVRNANI